MNSIKNGLMVGMVALSALSTAPALAEHSHHTTDYNNNYHNSNWDRRDINVRVNDNRYDRYERYDRKDYDRKDYDRHHRYQQAAWKNNDWNGQRTLYRNNWNRISRQRQQDLDAQMRAQWMAYHHNNWNGNYSWNTYNDPMFLDYLHTSNPGLLTTLRSYIGF